MTTAISKSSRISLLLDLLLVIGYLTSRAQADSRLRGQQEEQQIVVETISRNLVESNGVPCDNEYNPCGPYSAGMICVDTEPGDSICEENPDFQPDPDMCPGGCAPNQACVGGKCECKLGYYRKYWYANGCSEACSSDDVASEHCGDDQNASCNANNGQCTCNAGYTLNSDGTDCVITAQHATEKQSSKTATQFCDCHERSHCVNGACQCNKGFVPKVAGDFSACKAEEPADTCNCGQNSHCVNGACQCKVGYIPINHGDASQCFLKETAQKISNMCPVSCGAHASCVNGSCQCEDGYTKSFIGPCRRERRFSFSGLSQWFRSRRGQ